MASPPEEAGAACDTAGPRRGPEAAAPLQPLPALLQRQGGDGGVGGCDGGWGVELGLFRL